MFQATVVFHTVEEAKQFARMAETFPFPIELSLNNYTVNAKSIISIFSLEFSKPLLLCAQCDETSKISKAVKPYLYQEQK